VLHRAAQIGHVEVVKALVDLGADVHTHVEQNGYTALHVASERGHLVVVKALMQRGADLDALEHRGNSALALATVHGHPHVAQWLAAYASTRAALRAATQEPHRPPPPPPQLRYRTPRACAQCGASEWAEGGRLRKCGGCQLGARLRYCSVACQEQHWAAAHREQCSGRAAAQ